MTPPPSNPQHQRIGPGASHLVMDTNVVLDLWLFQNACSLQALARAKQLGLIWVSTAAMRAELERVLAYPHLRARAAQAQRTDHDLLAQYDTHVRVVEPQAVAAPRCKDVDDQKFVDLAVQYRATLLSRDRQVLKLSKRLGRVAACSLTPERWMAQEPTQGANQVGRTP